MEKDFASQPEDIVLLMGRVQREQKGLASLYALPKAHSDHSVKNRNWNDAIGSVSRYFYLSCPVSNISHPLFRGLPIL